LSFFLSSRRRHTRSKRDWSSDVCSSDLLFLPTSNMFSLKSTPNTSPVCPTALLKEIVQSAVPQQTSNALLPGLTFISFITRFLHVLCCSKLMILLRRSYFPEIF